MELSVYQLVADWFKTNEVEWGEYGVPTPEDVESVLNAMRSTLKDAGGSEVEWRDVMIRDDGSVYVRMGRLQD